MDIRIDTYYDVTCDFCGKPYSTDYEKAMGFMTKDYHLADFRETVKADGWKCLNGKNCCPNCVAKITERHR